AAVVVRDSKGKPIFTIGTALDITERKRVEKLREEFIEIASHELRTPLTPLKLQADIIRRLAKSKDFADCPRITDILNVVEKGRQQIDRIHRIVEAMLTTTRIESGGISLKCTVCDLADLVRRVVDRFQPEIASSGCSLSLELEEGVRG